MHRKRVQTIEGRIYDLVHCQGEASAKAIFRSMDSDGNGKVTYKEFCKFLEDQGFLLNDKERAYIMLRYDADGDGCIEYDEFLRKGQKGSWSGDEQMSTEDKAKLDAGISDYMAITVKADAERDMRKLIRVIANAFATGYVAWRWRCGGGR